MPLPGSPREPQFLQEIKEPIHQEETIIEVKEPVQESSNFDDNLSSLISKAKSMGIDVKPNWGESQLKMAIRLNK